MRDDNDSSTAEVLEHESRPDNQRRLVAVTSVVLAAVLAGLSLLMPYVFSSFESMFKELGANLPWLTQALLGVPDIVWIAVGAVGVVTIVAKDRVVSRGSAQALNAVILLVGAVFVVAALVGLFVPLLEIIRTIE